MGRFARCRSFLIPKAEPEFVVSRASRVLRHLWESGTYPNGTDYRLERDSGAYHPDNVGVEMVKRRRSFELGARDHAAHAVPGRVAIVAIMVVASATR